MKGTAGCLVDGTLGSSDPASSKGTTLLDARSLPLGDRVPVCHSGPTLCVDVLRLDTTAQKFKGYLVAGRGSVDLPGCLTLRLSHCQSAPGVPGTCDRGSVRGIDTGQNVCLDGALTKNGVGHPGSKFPAPELVGGGGGDLRRPSHGLESPLRYQEETRFRPLSGWGGREPGTGSRSVSLLPQVGQKTLVSRVSVRSRTGPSVSSGQGPGVRGVGRLWRGGSLVG